MLLRPTTKTMATGLLAVGLLTLAPSPAFAKQKETDRTAQCANHSDPDGDSNGGVDKPGGSGSISADRDCNNGCGNDDDREDDNRGRCGNKHTKEQAAAAEKARKAEEARRRQKAAQAQATHPEKVKSKVDVAPAVVSAKVDAAPAVTLTATGTTAPVATAIPPAAPADPTVAAAGASADPATSTFGAEPTTEVLGVTLERDDPAETSPASLPRTGAGIAGLTLAGATLIGTGRLLRRV